MLNERFARLLPANVKSILRNIQKLFRVFLFTIFRTLDLCLVLLFSPYWIGGFLKSWRGDSILLYGASDRQRGDNDSVESNTLFQSIKHSKFKNSVFIFCYNKCNFPTLAFVRKASVIRPKVAIFSSYNHRSSRQPAFLVVRLLKSKGCRIVTLWWDTCSQNFSTKYEADLRASDLNVVLDNPNGIFFGVIEKTLGNRVTFAHPPVWFEVESTDISRRKNDFFFCGSMASYRSHRRSLIEVFKKQNIKYEIFATGDTNLVYADYINKLRFSKIGLSLPESVDCDQLKARVFEVALSGALLIDRKNCQTDKFFRDGCEYLSFKDSAELQKLVKKIVADPSKYSHIAEQGYKRAKGLCDPDTFWEKVLS